MPLGFKQSYLHTKVSKTNQNSNLKESLVKKYKLKSTFFYIGLEFLTAELGFFRTYNDFLLCVKIFS